MSLCDYGLALIVATLRCTLTHSVCDVRAWTDAHVRTCVSMPELVGGRTEGGACCT